MHSVTATKRLIHQRIQGASKAESHYVMGDSQTMGRLWEYYPWKKEIKVYSHTVRTRLDVDLMYTIDRMNLHYVFSEISGDRTIRYYEIDGKQYNKLCDGFTKYRMGIERSSTGILNYYNSPSNFEVNSLYQWAGEAKSPIDRSIFGYQSDLAVGYTNLVSTWDIIAPHLNASIVRYYHVQGESYARVTIDTANLQEAKFWLLRGERGSDGDSLYRRSFYGEYRRIFHKVLGTRPVQSEQITQDQGLEYMMDVWNYLTSNEYLDMTNPNHCITRLYTWEAI